MFKKCQKQTNFGSFLNQISAETEIPNFAGTETGTDILVVISAGTGTEPNFGRSLLSTQQRENREWGGQKFSKIAWRNFRTTLQNVNYFLNVKTYPIATKDRRIADNPTDWWAMLKIQRFEESGWGRSKAMKGWMKARTKAAIPTAACPLFWTLSQLKGSTPFSYHIRMSEARERAHVEPMQT